MAATAPLSADDTTADPEWFDSTEVLDSATAAAQGEEDSQEGLDSMLVGDTLDTLGWDTTRINAGRFDSKNWPDTARLVLVDSANGKRYCQPCPGVVTSDFGQRHYRWHYGVDTRLIKGDTVRAAIDGIVRILGFDRRGYGHVVVVRHANGLETIYGHLSKKLVTTRQRLKAGDVIGLGGSTGRSTGPHLHFEVRYRGEPFNPHDLVDFEAGVLKSDTLVLTKANFAYLVELRKQQWCTVRSGDNLGKIARRYHTTIAKLCSMNHITRKTILRIGRKLRYQ
jgi:murein DD-endopeptidase MepM/ murein hydrolase activator NlpD